MMCNGICKLVKGLVALALYCCPLLAVAQTSILSVHLIDSLQTAVPNATIEVGGRMGFSGPDGRYSITLPSGEYSLTIRAIGYHTPIIFVHLTDDTVLQVRMQPDPGMLRELRLFSSHHLNKNEISTHVLGIKQIRKLPVLLGEVDPLKTITLLPGVKSGGEASAGIYVRGGGPDQNLVLLDGIPVYNPNHLLGFFSIFNGDAVRDVEVVKGGMPAEYGGRLSSIIAIDTREGSKDSIHGNGGIGLVSSRLSLEGPIIKNKSSFIVSARRTYIDQVAKMVAKNKVGKNGYYFYDINGKLDYSINDRNQLYLTLYNGRDDFSYVDLDNDGRDRLFNAVWGNSIAGLTWKQQVGTKVKHRFSAVYNRFDLDSHFEYNTAGMIFSSGLRDYQLASDWNYQSGHRLRWNGGLQYIWHRFLPGAGESNAGIQEFKSKISDQFAREAAAYLSADMDITTKLNVVAGMRFSYFNQTGPTSSALYDADGIPTGEIQQVKRGESIAHYLYPEPRINLRYLLPHDASIKLSYTRTIQYLHLATTSAATFPSDLWVPSSRQIKPERADQVAIGYFRDVKRGAYELSAEAYYKTMNNQIEFRPGAQLLLNQNLEGEMIFGKGRAYGLELFLQKKKGRLTGWLGYTLSRAERQFAAMNDGKPFPYRYDRTHDVSIVANYILGAKWEFSGVFVYGTGNALTMPTGRYTYRLGFNTIEQKPILTNINQYDAVNDYRMPAYHRLDIAFTYTPKPATLRRFRSSWNFSIYNLYSRANPYFIYLDTDDDDQTIKGKKVYLFPIMPGVSWNFKF